MRMDATYEIDVMVNECEPQREGAAVRARSLSRIVKSPEVKKSDRVFATLAEALRRQLGVQRFVILLLEPHSGDLWMDPAWSGLPAGPIRCFEPGPAGLSRVIEEGRGLILNSFLDDAAAFSGIERSLGLAIDNALCLPLQAGGRVYGAVQAVNRDGNRLFTEHDEAAVLQVLERGAAVLAPVARDLFRRHLSPTL